MCYELYGSCKLKWVLLCFIHHLIAWCQQLVIFFRFQTFAIIHLKTNYSALFPTSFNTHLLIPSGCSCFSTTFLAHFSPTLNLPPFSLPRLGFWSPTEFTSFLFTQVILLTLPTSELLLMQLVTLSWVCNCLLIPLCVLVLSPHLDDEFLEEVIMLWSAVDVCVCLLMYTYVYSYIDIPVQMFIHTYIITHECDSLSTSTM